MLPLSGGFRVKRFPGKINGRIMFFFSVAFLTYLIIINKITVTISTRTLVYANFMLTVVEPTIVNFKVCLIITVLCYYSTGKVHRSFINS